MSVYGQLSGQYLEVDRRFVDRLAVKRDLFPQVMD
jgi:hypothetical protein